LLLQAAYIAVRNDDRINLVEDLRSVANAIRKLETSQDRILTELKFLRMAASVGSNSERLQLADRLADLATPGQPGYADEAGDIYRQIVGSGEATNDEKDRARLGLEGLATAASKPKAP
jgi:hypothetical protein